QALHFNDRLGALAAGVVAGPLAVGALAPLLVGKAIALDGDFRKRRDRQTGVLAENHIDWFAADAAGVVVFGFSPGQTIRRGNQQKRVVAEADRHGARAALVKIFLADDAALFARRDVERERIFVVHHDAVAAEIDPAFVHIA